MHAGEMQVFDLETQHKLHTVRGSLASGHVGAFTTSLALSPLKASPTAGGMVMVCMYVCVCVCACVRVQSHLGVLRFVSYKNVATHARTLHDRSARLQSTRVRWQSKWSI